MWPRTQRISYSQIDVQYSLSKITRTFGAESRKKESASRSSLSKDQFGGTWRSSSSKSLKKEESKKVNPTGESKRMLRYQRRTICCEIKPGNKNRELVIELEPAPHRNRTSKQNIKTGKHPRRVCGGHHIKEKISEAENWWRATHRQKGIKQRKAIYVYIYIYIYVSAHRCTLYMHAVWLKHCTVCMHALWLKHNYGIHAHVAQACTLLKCCAALCSHSSLV